MQVVLVMFRDEGKRRSFSITRDVTVVGRREDCDFRIPLGEISRKHCKITKGDGVLRVEDMGSSNGTYHNGERVQACELQPGDTLQIGSVAFVVQIDGAPVDNELSPQRAANAPTATAEDSDRATVLAGDDSTAHAPAEVHPADSNANSSSNGASKAEFDPMSILDAEGSDVGPAIDDSGLSGDVMSDLAEQSHVGDED